MTDTCSALVRLQESLGGVPLDSLGESVLSSGTLRFCHPRMLHFGDAGAEYRAVRTAWALFDVSDRVQIELEGPDARKLLHGLCTNNILRLSAGAGCEAFLTSVQGRIIAHILVFAEEQSVWLETGPADESSLIAHLDRYLIRENVRLHGRTAEWAELLVTGPEAARELAALGAAVELLGAFNHLRWSPAGGPGMIRRVDLLGPTGFLLSVERARLVDVWKQLVTAGAKPAGAAAFHACRIEAGFPLDGLDVGDHMLAPEAERNDRAISFQKGCYLGQEPIARIDALGHVNRHLRRLELNALLKLEPGDPVLASEGQAAGTITSSAPIPGENRTVAWALLRTAYAGASTPLLIRRPNQPPFDVRLI